MCCGAGYGCVRLGIWVATRETRFFMATNIIVRSATEADAEALARLTNQLGYVADVGTTRGRVRGILGRATDLILVAEGKDGTVFGWLQAHASETLESGCRVEIVGLVVAENMRRQGIGQQLVTGAEAWGQKTGSSTVVVRSNVARTESHRFYAALGYLMVKTQAVYRKQISLHKVAR
jgi:GNAT superfamily N-acetyltransferase